MSREQLVAMGVSDPKILEVEIPEDKQLHRPKTIVARSGGGGVLGGEHMDFTDCIRNGGQTYAPAEIGHRTISIAHIGNIAFKLTVTPGMPCSPGSFTPSLSLSTYAKPRSDASALSSVIVPVPSPSAGEIVPPCGFSKTTVKSSLPS